MASIKVAVYNRFRGADFASDPANVDKSRSPLCTNMVADEGGMPEKRMGWRTVKSIVFPAGTYENEKYVHGIWCVEEKRSGWTSPKKVFYVHARSEIYTWVDGDQTATLTTPIITGLLLSGQEKTHSRAVTMNGALWVLTGYQMIRCKNGQAALVTELEDAYIPLTVITREPSGGGVTLENINMATPCRRNSFQTDGTEMAFLVDSTLLDLELTMTAQDVLPGDTAYWDDDHAHGGKYWSFVNSTGANFMANERIRLDLEAGKAYYKRSSLSFTMDMTSSASAPPGGKSLNTRSTPTARTAVWAKVWGETKTEGTDYTVCRELGKFTFGTAPAAPAAGSGDGLEVKFAKTVEGYADIVNKCSICTTYGAGTSDRMVISGNKDHPNQDYICGYNDPTYWPDLGYYDVGLESVPIIGYARVGSYLAIIKEDTGTDSTVFFRSASVQEDGEVLFTTQQTLAGVGAVSKGAFTTLLDEPLFLSGTGIMAVTSNYLTGERVGQNRSYYINPKLVNEELQKAEAVNWKGMALFAFPNGHVYVLDGRQNKTYKSQSLGDYVYEGYYWEDVPAFCWCNAKGDGIEELYFGTEDGKLCRMNSDIDTMSRFADDGAAIKAVWATKMDDDGDPTVQKTMLKRGCAVTLKPYHRSSAEIGFRTDIDPADWVASGTVDIFDWTDIDFSRFTFDSNDGARDIFFNTKVKKYKRLQIVIRNEEVNEGFGVYAVTKHYVAGNFAKR